MGKILKRFAMALCLLALCISTMGMAVFAASTVTAQIPVHITQSGTVPAAPETFIVEVTAADPKYPMPNGAENGVYTMAMMGESTESIVIEFNKLGVYNYTVKQIPGTNGNCYYDDTVYHVTAFVTNSETGSGYDLSIVVYRNEETEKCDDILFKNVYANPDEVVITAVKTLDGKTPEDGAFRFELLDSDGKLVETVINVGQDVTFKPLSYYEVGTYKYQLKEAQGYDPKIIYDQTVYDVIVDVVKDEDGNYSASLSYENNGKVCTGFPSFANQTKTDIPQTGDNFQITLWISLMVLSVIGIASLVILSRKNRNKT